MKPEPIASKRHTLTLLAIFFGVAVTTALQMHKGAIGGAAVEQRDSTVVASRPRRT